MNSQSSQFGNIQEWRALFGMQDLVEETKKNSGLDEKALSNQPGNNPSQTFGTTDLKTGRGQSAAGKLLLCMARHCLPSLRS